MGIHDHLIAEAAHCRAVDKVASTRSLLLWLLADLLSSFAHLLSLTLLEDASHGNYGLILNLHLETHTQTRCGEMLDSDSTHTKLALA